MALFMYESFLQISEEMRSVVVAVLFFLGNLDAEALNQNVSIPRVTGSALEYPINEDSNPIYSKKGASLFCRNLEHC